MSQSRDKLRIEAKLLARAILDECTAMAGKESPVLIFQRHLETQLLKAFDAGQEQGKRTAKALDPRRN